MLSKNANESFKHMNIMNISTLPTIASSTGISTSQAMSK